jgi:hypothetical protein
MMAPTLVLSFSWVNALSQVIPQRTRTHTHRAEKWTMRVDLDCPPQGEYE